ncbi:23S rRNA (uracil(1939)-C(5))-methyltransferase RlmD [Collinsella sp. zg1085]|uniref:23S rRNA (uracil(1939)-C(5))-methyltransferase RlmD n=1 Tax=Collinsella sp. zg1085 TaxID=2844380 RepID=UPI001C0D0BAE|nr:23S rRNA (uracil(1939)-C(5))-methyltransferase RlmD [Collinsella sp. zg1085]QWT18029.1 23S rRNA (uracil(1939)-C(5))-methyltransferase RlmD [Collinsella sp. zg1085]
MQLSIESMVYGPEGLAHMPDGKAVFVMRGLIGDTVDVHLLEDGPRFARAEVREILEPSPYRVSACAPEILLCGGAPWGCLSRSAQHAAKRNNLISTLTRIGAFSPDWVNARLQPIKFAKDAWGYRNKIELSPTTIGGKLKLGMHAINSPEIIPINSWPLFEASAAKSVKAVVGALQYLGNSRDLQLERVGIRASRRTKALEIALWTPTGAFPRAQVARVLSDAVRTTSIVRVMSKGENKARRVQGVEALSGEGSWTERIGSETMRLSAPSFFQVNTAAAEILIDTVMDGLKVQPHETALDLYCGAGTFTLPLARRAEFVAAVEAYGPAVRDLRRNLEIAKLDNVDVIGGDAVREFPDEEADVLVVDPPRAGLKPEAIKLIARSGARAFTYVSCDPATLARDLRRIEDEGTYTVESITPVDLFPQTYHIETAVFLSRKE